jgi:transcriptional regulator with XRE-family HTH domain
MSDPTLGQVVRFHRERAKLSRRELSRLSEVSETAIYDVEHDKPTVRLSTVTRLLDVLNVRISFSSPLMDELRSRTRT